MAQQSAGVLLYRRRGGEVEVLLAHPGGPYWTKRDERAWTVPKGELMEGEESIACALRELGEELGPAAPDLAPGDLVELGVVRQRGGKRVTCWAAEADFDPAALDSNLFELEWPPRTGRLAEFPEVDRVEWYDPEAARAKLNPAQVKFLDRLLRHLAEA